ncbi:hypothetical protein RHMOL_Rhmol04G0314700 [Rhododendron molle]|uniref:Uncharacterized protein n=1 Tax=Rhododendron molle TaxID=49168 RepID=A0ACC0P8S0_RHOML|nr:hypothetical protein RHMOL_Rhmol04G0314700 [Rhododendron molle]
MQVSLPFTPSEQQRRHSNTCRNCATLSHRPIVPIAHRFRKISRRRWCSGSEGDVKGEKSRRRHAVTLGGEAYDDEFIDKLIQWKKDLIKEPDADGRTPLHNAAETGDVEAKDHEGNTPMHVLAHNYKGKQNLLFHFVGAADLEALNNEALTPIDILFRKMGDRKYWLLQKKFLRGLDEKDQGGKGMMNNREQKEQHEKVKQKAAEEMSKMAKTHIIVATLISTISFAAGSTIPGGYELNLGPNEGMAVLVRDAAFKAFVITNTIAMICSTSSVFLYVSASLFNIKGNEGERRVHRYEIAFWLIITAMVAMMLAFSTGAYVVLAHSLGLAIVTCVIACSSFIVYAFELKKHFEEEIS